MSLQIRGLGYGMVLILFQLQQIDINTYLSNRNLIIPFIEWDAGVSPGWTLAVSRTTGLLVLNLILSKAIVILMF